MIIKILSIYKLNKKIFENISYLSVIQIVVMLLPFITYPYLIRVLGLGVYGKVMLSQAVVSYVAIFINFGFNISATKSVSEILHDKKQLDLICSAIFYSKIIIWILVTIFYVITIFFFFDEFKDRLLFLSAYTLTFNEFLVCQWFYQAKEELKIIALSSVIAKISNVIFIFILIKTSDDYYLVSLITGISFFVMGGYTVFNVFKYHVNFVKPDFDVIMKVTNDSLNLFLTSAVIAIKNKLDVVLIGIFISNEMVAIYDFAQKILNILLVPITIINNAIFSKMNREKNKIFLKKVIISSLCFSILYTIIFMILLPLVMPYIFIVTEHSLNITKLMIISVIFFSVSLPLAQNGLIVFNYSKLHLLGMISTTLIYITIMLIGNYIGELKNIYFFVYTSLFLFSYETIYRYFLCKWKKLI